MLTPHQFNSTNMTRFMTLDPSKIEHWYFTQKIGNYKLGKQPHAKYDSSVSKCLHYFSYKSHDVITFLICIIQKRQYL